MLPSLEPRAGVANRRNANLLGFLWCAALLFVRAASGRKRYNVLGALDAVTHRLVR